MELPDYVHFLLLGKSTVICRSDQDRSGSQITVFLIFSIIHACKAQFCSAELTKLLVELQREASGRTVTSVPQKLQRIYTKGRD